MHPDKQLAMAAWICPAAAWVSQIFLALTLRGISGLGLFWAAMALLQLALVLAGLVLGIVVLCKGKQVPARSRAAARVGIVLSTGTLFLGVILLAVEGL